MMTYDTTAHHSSIGDDFKMSAMFWLCSGYVFGYVLVMFCVCFGYVLAVFWMCSGHVLAMFWDVLGYVLAMVWLRSRCVLAMCWLCSAHTIGAGRLAPTRPQ